MGPVKELNKIKPFRKGKCSQGCCTVTRLGKGNRAGYVSQEGRRIVAYDNRDNQTCIGEIFKKLSKTDAEEFISNLAKIQEVIPI